MYLLIGISVSVVLLVAVAFTAACKRHRIISEEWRSKEDDFCRWIEDRTGQKIRQTMELDASPSGDFMKDGRPLWIAFTTDSAALFEKTALVTDKGKLVVYPKNELSLRRVASTVYELSGPKGGRNYFVGLPRAKMDIIRRHIQIKVK